MDHLHQKISYIIFVLEGDDPQVLLFSHSGKQNNFGFPSTKITDLDAWSSVNAAARCILNKIGDIDIRQLSIGKHKSYSEIVNFNSMDEARKQWDSEPKIDFEGLELIRNPQKYLWEKQFSEAPIWNDDNDQHIIFFVYINTDDIQIGTMYLFLSYNSILKKLKHRYKIIPSSQIQQIQIKNNRLKQLLNVFDLNDLLLQKQFLESKVTYIYLGFKVKGFELWNPPRPFLFSYAIFTGLFRRRQEKWLHFNVPDGQFPNDQQLKQASTIILTGSSCSAYDQLKWIRDTESFITDTYHQYEHLRYLGICFGLQVLIQAFGGKVEPTNQRKLNRGFYFYGNEMIDMDVNEFKRIKGFEQINLKHKAVINKAHGDECTIIPPLFIKVGQSKSCLNEILLSRDHRILGYQSHPEYSNSFQILYLLARQAYFHNKTADKLLNDPNFLSYWQMGVNDLIHRQICTAFLKQKK